MNQVSSSPKTSAQSASKKSFKRTALALWLMIGPTVLIFVVFVLFSINNLIAAGVAESSATDTATAAAIVLTTINVILYIAGVIGVVAWLPGLITGIVLLATKK